MGYSKKEKMLYTLIICFAMEFIMAYYNYFFHTSAFLDEAFWLACIEFVPAFLVGVICEWFIISKMAKFVAKKMDKRNIAQCHVIRVNEFIIAIGMMCVISVFGMLYHSDELSSFLLKDFIVDFMKNAIVGIPVFMLFISPIARKLTNTIVKPVKKEDILT